ncbi:MAG: outer membrane protein [Pseudomonadota bacterium]
MSVRVSSLIGALAASLTSSAAFAGGLISSDAENSGPYVAVFGGGVFLDDAGFSGPGGAVSVDTDTGYDFGGAVGYSLPVRVFGVFQPRYEIEVSYLDADISRSGGVSAEGERSALAVFFNGYYDIRLSAFGKLTPYVGGGAGVGFVDLEAFGGSALTPIASADDTVFAGHFAAGATYALSERIELYGEGRYVRTSKVDTALLSPTAFLDDERFEGFIANGGLRWKF